MILNFNPLIESQGGIRLNQVKGWNDPAGLESQYIADIKEVSGGYLNYQVVSRLDIDSIPKKADGFQYTDDSYLSCLANTSTCHFPDTADYLKMLNDNGVCTQLNSGAIDEVWIWGGPYFGYYESRLAGPGAYWYNSPPLGGTGCTKLLPVMGFNYERGVESMLHSFGHRFESALSNVFEPKLGGWWKYGYGTPPVPGAVDTNWGKFTVREAHQGQTSLKNGCGFIHAGPNAIADNYVYGDTAVKTIDCDDFSNYPNLTGVTTTVNCSVWGCSQYGFLKWWLGHIPKYTGTATDGKLNNWWKYAVNGVQTGWTDVNPGGDPNGKWCGGTCVSDGQCKPGLKCVPGGPTGYNCWAPYPTCPATGNCPDAIKVTYQENDNSDYLVTWKQYWTMRYKFWIEDITNGSTTTVFDTGGVCPVGDTTNCGNCHCANSQGLCTEPGYTQGPISNSTCTLSEKKACCQPACPNQGRCIETSCTPFGKTGTQCTTGYGISDATTTQETQILGSTPTDGTRVWSIPISWVIPGHKYRINIDGGDGPDGIRPNCAVTSSTFSVPLVGRIQGRRYSGCPANTVTTTLVKNSSNSIIGTYLPNNNYSPVNTLTNMYSTGDIFPWGSTYTVTFPPPAGYTAQYSLCQNCIDHTDIGGHPYVSGNSVTVTLPSTAASGYYTGYSDLYWKCIPNASPTPSPSTHRACVNKTCQVVTGAGTDSCQMDSQCIPSPTPVASASPVPSTSCASCAKVFCAGDSSCVCGKCVPIGNL